MSKSCEMAPHFRKAVQEIDGDIAGLQQDIAKLQNARSAIVDLYGGETPMEPEPMRRSLTGAMQGAGAKPKRKYKRRMAADPASSGPNAARGRANGIVDAEGPTSGKKLSPESVALMAVARKMPEPISAITLSIAGTVDKKLAANRIFAWERNGWLEKTGRGEFKRTQTFPAQAP